MSFSRCPPGFGPGAGGQVLTARVTQQGETVFGAFIAVAVLVMPTLLAAISPAPPIAGIRFPGRPAEDPPGRAARAGWPWRRGRAGTASRLVWAPARDRLPAVEPQSRPASWTSARAADGHCELRGRPGSAPPLCPGRMGHGFPGFRYPSGIAKLLGSLGITRKPGRRGFPGRGNGRGKGAMSLTAIAIAEPHAAK
jgi:hypothetical protein